jgi:hypothetical protein
MVCVKWHYVFGRFVIHSEADYELKLTGIAAGNAFLIH